MTPDSYGTGPPGYLTPGTPQYGIDDMRRERGLEQVSVLQYGHSYLSVVSSPLINKCAVNCFHQQKYLMESN
jgi:hypothetical protein